ncbi:hypothetical protein [Acidianus manzaensis]|uniref:Uncharacterized protein n=1 Tax=Acidianus manzaensis TaxID=282676 RepID=A0A1W6JWV1_9CREN|nr:hypothetical protein [Acidianus manzaensis]ARM74735.1 hypothetical protein B6F84_00975 [Acidianus manzaensis]
MDLPFYKLALVRNLISKVIEENPEDLKDWEISNDVREDLCSLTDEELIESIRETEYIVNKTLSEEEIMKIKDKLSTLCH